MNVQRFAVFGQPVAHSLSPRIHQAFARELGIAIDYRAIEVDPLHFPAALAKFADEGGVGANITLPLKQLAMVACNELSARAEAARAVNTLVRTDHGWFGDNTDGAGLVRDLTERHRLDLRSRRCLMLGAGGAAHGVAPALLDAGVASMVIVNRTADRADKLADALGDPARVSTRYWSDLREAGEFELIVNATSAGRSGGALDLPFVLAAPRFAAVDLSYGEAAIGFLAWAKAAKADFAIDGLGMLVEQAAEAFERWHGRRPDSEAVYRALMKNAAVLHSGD